MNIQLVYFSSKTTFFFSFLQLFLITRCQTEFQKYPLSGFMFQHPDAARLRSNSSLTDRVLIVGSDVAYGKFLSIYGHPSCEAMKYYDCMSNLSSSQGLTILSRADKELQLLYTTHSESLAVILLKTEVAMALGNLDESVKWVELLVNRTEVIYHESKLEQLLNPFPRKSVGGVLYALYLASSRNCHWVSSIHVQHLVRRLFLSPSNASNPAPFPPLQYSEFSGATAAELLTVSQQAAATLLTTNATNADSRARRRRGGAAAAGRRVRIGYINGVGFDGVTLFIAQLFLRRRDQVRRRRRRCRCRAVRTAVPRAGSSSAACPARNWMNVSADAIAARNYSNLTQLQQCRERTRRLRHARHAIAWHAVAQ
jgi:hypothetical protein